MESTPRQVLSGVAGPARPGAHRVRESGRRRRPTGAPPPLPRSIQTTGVWWAATAVVLVALARVAFGPAAGSLGVAVTVWDDAVVRWLGGLHVPGLTGLMEALVASTGSVAMIAILRGGTCWRCWRCGASATCLCSWARYSPCGSSSGWPR
jgi:hypothetical protein